MPTAQDRKEWTDTFKDELTVVNARRQKPATTSDGLVGLAISGGGIRSATFALGILDSLRRADVLKRVDYLSTVSGGGYIGGWLSANCKRHPGWLEPDADWDESVKHLRRYSNYLSPQVGFFSADTWSMVTIWLRNTSLVQLTVILAIACALMLPRLLYEVFAHWPEVGPLRWITILLYILGAVGIAGNHWRLTALKPLKLLSATAWRLGLGLGLLLLGAAWAWAYWWDFHPFSGGAINISAAFPVAMLLVGMGFCLQPVAVQLVALWQSKDPPKQVNYTQGYAQAMVIIPLMAAAFLVAAILWGESLGLVPGARELASIDSYSGFFLTAWRYWPFPLSVVFISFWLFSFGGIQCRTTAGKAAACVAPLVAIVVLHAFLCAVMLILHAWAADASGAGAWKAFVWGPPLVTLSFVQTIVILIAMMGRNSIDDVREWWSRLGAWLGIYAVAWMVITVSAVYGPQWVTYALNSNPLTMLTAGGGWVGTVLGGLFAGKSGTTGTDSAKSMTTKAKELLAAAAPFVFIAGLLVAVAYVLDQVVTINAEQTWTSVGGSNWRHVDHAWFLYVSLIVFGACLLALLVMAARVDINEFSLNAFYRNRLVRCYLGATRFGEGERNPQNFTGFDGKDDVPLAQLVKRNPPLEECDPTKEPPPALTRELYGPLHIVNCALNLGGSGDLALHTRHSAVFTLSPLYSGSRYRSREQTGKSEELGYVRTEVYGGAQGAPTLGQAIAVSGAAASPNMGYHTSPVVAFLLTLFNVRLGWWFPNPRLPETPRPTPRFSLRYLFAELFGGASDKSNFVMISDGGHFENLAAYELVKRRCGTIIISDGECDPTLGFDGLGSLIRMCEVDFGAKIKVDVADIRTSGAPAWSTQRWAIGRIEYGQGIPDGKLIYLKASMTGKEDTAIRQYKSAHAEFPHETTGDQFYGEDQFESYRRLGRELAADALSRPLDTGIASATASPAVAAETGA